MVLYYDVRGCDVADRERFSQYTEIQSDRNTIEPAGVRGGIQLP